MVMALRLMVLRLSGTKTDVPEAAWYWYQD